MKTRFQKTCFKIAIILSLVSIAIWLMGCAIKDDHYPLDCRYNSLVAGHVAETQWIEQAYIATDHNHAQAFYNDSDKDVWLTVRHDCVVRDVQREVAEIIKVYSLAEWDKRLRLNWDWK